MSEDALTLTLCGTRIMPRASGALWLAETRMLVVSDLHLGKAERNARRGGGFWPPYDTTETLNRLGAEIAMLDPACVVTLGDSFDDDACADELADETRARLEGMVAARRWIWVTGNHDPAPVGLGGEGADVVTLDPLVLRHIAEQGARGEVSGHYHPKASLRIRGRRIARKCFLISSERMILPAFGAFTGGLNVFDPAFAPLFGGDACAILTGTRAVAVPLARLRVMAA